MIPLVPEPATEMRRRLEAISAQAVEGGASPPVWMTVVETGREWLREVAGAPPAERAAAVAVVSDEGSLLRAVQLGFGGAAWLPPSTVALTAAFEAAAAGS